MSLLGNFWFWGSTRFPEVIHLRYGPAYLVLSKPLVKSINFLSCECIFPDLLKFANVIPVFKKGGNLDYNNCRPISLISNIGELIEKIIKRFFSFIEKNLFFCKQQCGFRNKLSTSHAFIDITNKIQEACDSGQYAFGIYGDFKRPLI